MGQKWDTPPRQRAIWRWLAAVGEVVALLVHRLIWIVPGGFALGDAAQSLITAGHPVVAQLLVAGIATAGVAGTIIATNRRWRIDPALWKLAAAGLILSTLMATIAVKPAVLGVLAWVAMCALPGVGAAGVVLGVRAAIRRWTG